MSSTKPDWLKALADAIRRNDQRNVLGRCRPWCRTGDRRHVIGGHVVATLVGLAMLRLTGPHAWAAAVAVRLAVIAMYATGTFHPPAGINPLLVVSNNLPGSFLFAPVLMGAVLLTVFAWLWHRGIRPPAVAAALGVVRPATAVGS